MKFGAIAAIVLTLAGLSAMVFAFLTNASPYVGVAEAQVTQGDNLHVAGAIELGSVSTNISKAEVRFKLKDDKGDTMQVVYHGPPPANLGTATKVVAVGGMKDGDFHSGKLLIKCPSKYESTKS